MSWKPNSIIWFDDPQLINSLWTENRKDIEEIFNFFENTDIKKCWLFANADDESDDFIDMQQKWWDIPTDENYTDFEEWIEYESIQSIINDHNDLLFAKTKEKRIEIMSDIIDKIWIIATELAQYLSQDVDKTLPKQIRYIITEIINILRLDPYINMSENKDSSEKKLDQLTNYLDTQWKSMWQMVLEISTNKAEENRLLWEDNHSILLREIYKRREWYKTQKDELRKYYDMYIQYYITVLGSMILYWKGCLPWLYNTLYDLIYVWSALDILSEED